MTSITPTTVPTKRLAASLTESSMTMTLNNIRGWDGVNLTAADFGTRAYGVFRNAEGTLMELFEYDPSTIASASITILKRGLKFNGDLTTEVTANKLVWVRADTLVELGSDVPQLLAHMVRIIESPEIVDQLRYTTELTPLDRKDLVTKGYVDDNVNGGAVSLNRLQEAGNAGETVAIRELLYFDQTDDEWKRCDADTIATLHNVRLAISGGSGTNGNAITGGVITRGLVSGFSGLTAGDSYYASNTTAAITNTPGTIRRKIGVAKSTTELYFDPDIEKMTYDEVRRNLGMYAVDAVGTDAYAVTLSPAPTQYTQGMVVDFKPATRNTGACTINVNSLGAQAIVKDVNLPLVTGDIMANQICRLIYDGTNFQLLSRFRDSGFGGDGSDGALSTSSGTTNLDAAGAKVLIKNYTSISITGTATVTVTNPHANGTILILKSQGPVTITSTAPGIDLRGVGASGGGSDAAGSLANFILFSADTSNGKTGSTGTGGAAGGANSNTEFYTNSEDKMHRRAIFVKPGCGGAGGVSGFGGNPGAGGRGGGALIIECGGLLNFTGTINASGSNGAAGGTSSRSGSGGGGGGAAGMVVILYNALTSAAGTITATGGNGGNGGTEAGSATSATGGGGGGGAGCLANAGGAGGNSEAGGGSPSAGAGGGGGGGGSSDGGAANGGGTGGTGGSSIGGLVIQNKYF